MTVLRPVDDEERRARLGRRHLIEPAVAPSVEELVDRLVVLHATDPATIYLSVGARLPGSTPADVDDALFGRRSVFRTMAMRRTLFVCTHEVGAEVEGSSAPEVARTERQRLEKFLADTDPAGRDPADPTEWLAAVSDRVLDALDLEPVGGEPDGRTARELTTEVPELATKLVAGKGTRQEMQLSATSRVLGLMAVEGLLIRGRPSSGWTGRQYRWYRRDRWWPTGTGPMPTPDGDQARVGLLERYLARFGPATLSDLVWWTGWTKTKTRTALASVDTVEVSLQGDAADEPGLLLAADVEPIEAPDPWAALLPSLDPTPMGWKHRSWYLGDHRAALFDRNGNIGPTVWVDGRIVGGWGQRSTGELEVRLLEDVGADRRDLIEVEADRARSFLGGVVVKPSFPTPLQKALASG